MKKMILNVAMLFLGFIAGWLSVCGGMMTIVKNGESVDEFIKTFI